MIDVPTEDFEVSERGIMLGGNKVVPWHRVIRYTRETTQEVDEAFRMHAEMRIWLDDGTDEGEIVKVRADRFEQGQWTVDLLLEKALNVEAGIFHVTKSRPVGAVLEFERLPAPVEAPPPRLTRPSAGLGSGLLQHVRRVDIAFIAVGTPRSSPSAG